MIIALNSLSLQLIFSSGHGEYGANLLLICKSLLTSVNGMLLANDLNKRGSEMLGRDGKLLP
jgi:hypothetical protein